jgi:DNA polymerase III subunit gamma/tau
MSYQALARKWRPQTFRDIIGQETVVRTLQNAIEQERIHHAYLFSGVRGVGKTTAARIFAKAINCVKGPTAEPCNECSICREITEGIDLDVREIDAATYTNVDNIRELREVTQFQPARDRTRIFIIDEAHMLSTSAWNALLKLIEEPPPHVAFIMATTEMHKVPATILSRVQRFVFSKITQADLVARLEEICREEGIEAETAALEMLARRGEGSVRDSLSLLDQIIAFSGRTVRLADVTTILGLSDTHFFARVAREIGEGDAAAILASLEEASDSGRDFKLLYRDFLGFLRNVLLLRSGAPDSMLSLPPEEVEVIRGIATMFEYSEVLRLLNLLIRDDEIISKAEHQRLAVEISLLKAAMLPRLRAVEDVLSGGNAPPAPPARRSTARAELPRTPAASVAPPLTPPESSRSTGTGPDADELLRFVHAQRKLTGSYLGQAANCAITADTITWEFEPDQQFAMDFVSDTEQLRFLESLAAEAFGRPMRVRVVPSRQPEAAAVIKEQRSALAADPVLQSFAKHLGGEVVLRKNRKSSPPD